jgi:hypothetical protein
MRKHLMAALLFILTVGGCSGGIHTCTITSLTAGSLYAYSYLDDTGTRVGGEFVPSGQTIEVSFHD